MTKMMGLYGRRRLWIGARGRALLGCVLAVLFVTGSVGGAHAELRGGEVTDRLDQKQEAFRTWLPPALRGDALAQFELGAAFATGRAEPEDFAEAARWFYRSAMQGNPRAQNGLAVLYSKGLGVKQSFVEAYIWWGLAAESFMHGQRRDQAVELRDMIGAFLSPAEIEAARHLADSRKSKWE